MFLCNHHAQAGNRGHGRAQTEHFRIFSDRACVVEYIENNYTPELKRIWQATIEANPAWGRAQGETRSDYVARMRELHRDKGLTAAVKRMAI